jgi:acyl-CoA thioesterase FadM
LLDIEVRCGQVGDTSFTLAFVIFAEPEKRCLADGTFVIVTVSRSTFKPIRVPDKLREMLETLNVAE